MRRRLLGAVVHAVFLGAVAAHGAAPPFAGVTTATVVSPTVDATIPDDGALVDLVEVTGPGVVVDVDVQLDLRHASPDQLDIRLVSPAGTTVTLTTDNGGGNDDVFAGVVFDDQAPALAGERSALCLRNATFTNGLSVGVVQPEGALSALFGEAAAGPWALVVVDDQGGTTGQLVSWSLVVTTLPALPAAAPAVVLGGSGGDVPDPPATGFASTVTAGGLGRLLLGVRVTVDVTHTQADQLDMFLTAPSGHRIDLVTDVGGANDDLYAGTVFDDRAPDPASDVTPLPANGTAFGAVIPEGALGAFLGEDPNGTWTLEVVDDGGGQRGRLRSWALELVASATCGDGVLDPGETCDDGNGLDGDGCQADCTPTPPGAGGGGGNEDCGNCADDDADGFVDALDADCAPAPLELRSVSLLTRGAKTALRLAAGLGAEPPLAGPMSLVIADAGGVVACSALGDLQRRGRDGAAVRGRFADANLTGRLRTRGGSLVLRGRGLALGGLDDPALSVGLRIGDRTWVGSATLRARGPRRVHP